VLASDPASIGESSEAASPFMTPPVSMAACDPSSSIEPASLPVPVAASELPIKGFEPPSGVSGGSGCGFKLHPATKAMYKTQAGLEGRLEDLNMPVPPDPSTENANTFRQSLSRVRQPIRLRHGYLRRFRLNLAQFFGMLVMGCSGLPSSVSLPA
jgi:hypothetical protein